MNNWNAIRAFYKKYEAEIFSEPKNEWGIAAYSWESVPGMIRMTPIEEWLWADLRAANAVIYPQYPVGRYFVDFGNPVAKVAIECDGAAYHLDKEKDASRDAELGAMGWSVYRITGSECRTDFDEETREAGYAANFVKQICEWHDISRNTLQAKKEIRTARDTAGGMMLALFDRECAGWRFGA